MTARGDMAAYDLLPPEVRAQLRDADDDVNPWPVLRDQLRARRVRLPLREQRGRS